MVGFLLAWPTLIALAMLPILVWMYLRLARHEELEALAAFGDVYRDDVDPVPGFVPRLSRLASGRAW